MEERKTIGKLLEEIRRMETVNNNLKISNDLLRIKVEDLVSGVYKDETVEHLTSSVKNANATIAALRADREELERQLHLLNKAVMDMSHPVVSSVLTERNKALDLVKSSQEQTVHVLAENARLRAEIEGRDEIARLRKAGVL